MLRQAFERQGTGILEPLIVRQQQALRRYHLEAHDGGHGSSKRCLARFNKVRDRQSLRIALSLSVELKDFGSC